jgi:large subunit ribosomal protein L4
MPTIDIFNKEGQKVSEMTLSDKIFGSEVKKHLLWLVVKAQQAAKRAGTHDTKTRGQVNGGGKKPYRQKGTGWARQGTRRAPNHVGGGTVFGPHPRKYNMSVPKKVRKAAIICALSLRASEKRVILLENLDIDEIKTKKIVSLIEKFDAKKALIVEIKENEKVVLSTKNLAKHKWLPPEAINVYDILNHDTLIMNVETAKKLETQLANPVRK